MPVGLEVGLEERVKGEGNGENRKGEELVKTEVRMMGKKVRRSMLGRDGRGKKLGDREQDMG